MNESEKRVKEVWPHAIAFAGNIYTHDEDDELGDDESIKIIGTDWADAASRLPKAEAEVSGKRNDCEGCGEPVYLTRGYGYSHVDTTLNVGCDARPKASRDSVPKAAPPAAETALNAGANYVANRECRPTEVRFSNGRRVYIKTDADGPFLEVEMMNPSEAWLRNAADAEDGAFIGAGDTPYNRAVHAIVTASHAKEGEAAPQTFEETLDNLIGMLDKSQARCADSSHPCIHVHIGTKALRDRWNAAKASSPVAFHPVKNASGMEVCKHCFKNNGEHSPEDECLDNVGKKLGTNWMPLMASFSSPVGCHAPDYRAGGDRGTQQKTSDSEARNTAAGRENLSSLPAERGDVENIRQPSDSTDDRRQQMSVLPVSASSPAVAGGESEKVLDVAIIRVLEQRCERGTDWDKAVLACADALRRLRHGERAEHETQPLIKDVRGKESER